MKYFLFLMKNSKTKDEFTEEEEFLNMNTNFQTITV